jgi:hypothetical protein
MQQLAVIIRQMSSKANHSSLTHLVREKRTVLSWFFGWTDHLSQRAG